MASRNALRIAGLAAVLAPLLAVFLGASMAVMWAVEGGSDFSGPPGGASIGPWLRDHLPLLDEEGNARRIWARVFFVALLLPLPAAQTGAAAGHLVSTSQRS